MRNTLLAIIFFSASLIVISESALAAVACFDQGLKSFGKLTDKVSEYADSGTHRQVVDDYADSNNLDKKQFAKTVAPTGRLRCKGGEATANLIVKGDVILSSGHPFVDRKTCESKSKPQDCTFIIEGAKPVRIKELIASGNKCPQPGGPNSDWSILKLEKSIGDVTPYKFKASNPTESVAIQDVISVAGSSADFGRMDKATKKITYPKHVQNCKIKRLFYSEGPSLFGSNCDSSYGASGGAILSTDLANPTIIGINLGSARSKAEGEQEIKTGIPVRKNYNNQDWYATGLAITGDLYEELVKATK